MKNKFFKIRASRQPKIQKPPTLLHFVKSDIELTETQLPSFILTLRSDNHSKNKNISN
jgi:hypothetical protein